MAPDTSGSQSNLPQSVKGVQDSGTARLKLPEDSIPIDQLDRLAKGIEKIAPQDPASASAVRPNGSIVPEDDGRDLNTKDHEDATALPDVGSSSPVVSGLSPSMEKYRRMEAILLKHRKEWESKTEVKLSGDIEWNRSRNSHFLEGPMAGPWATRWEYTSHPQYQRPNPFELAEGLDQLPLLGSRETEDEFDVSMNYNAARNRVRRNFEWDMDRLFLAEEITVRKKIEAAERVAAKDQKGNAAEDDTKGKTGPALKLNYLRWSNFKQPPTGVRNPSGLIEVLMEDPVIDDGNGFVRRTRVSRNTRKSEVDDNTPSDQRPLPERIRINSALLGDILATMEGISPSEFGDDGDDFVLVRPFKTLFHFSSELRSLTKTLEDKFSKKEQLTTHTEDGTPDDDQAPNKEQLSPGEHANHTKAELKTCLGDESSMAQISQVIQTAKAGEAIEEMLDEEAEDREENDEHQKNDSKHTELTLQHLKVLVDFIDSEIETKRMQLATPACKKVFFTDLWYLFRPGQEVIGRDGKQAYRVVSVNSPRHKMNQPWDAWLMYNSQHAEKKKNKRSPFTITCVYIDFDGSYIGPVLETVDFKHFEGQSDITSLPVYPIRLHTLKQHEVSSNEWKELEFLPEEKRYRQYLINRGTKFVDVLGLKAMYYAGPTMGVRDEVESQVIIDFETAFSIDNEKDSMLPPEVQSQVEKRSLPDEDEEEGRLLDGACMAACCQRDWVCNDTYIDDRERTRYVNSLLPNSDGSNRRPSIAIIPQPLKELKDSTNKTGYSVSDDELVIMSCRVFGFVLRQRRWAQLDITYLTELDAGRRPVQEPHDKDITAQGGSQKTAFDNLVLEEGQKPVIQALVAQHFRDKEHRAGQTAKMDIVKGKGKGLILLLHGAPGVGKTSTAEGVAELFNRPLFQITCGDLGTNAKEVEKSLDVTFTLANRWNCILLLDEADVFLAQRNKEDFQRNGLVAVFLRVLEYYAGVLFLTTNRIGDFDEAFTSRIHVSLYYPALDCEKTIKVFRINMELIKDRFREKGRNIAIDKIEDFAKAHYDENPSARWNGRQIRNACQTALALAEFEAQGNSHEAVLNPDAVVHLKEDHFKTVQDAYLEFAKYMNRVYGSSAETRAQEGQVRASLDLVNGRPGDSTGLDTKGKNRAAFGSMGRAKSETQQPATPVSQPAVVQQQPSATGQAPLQPVYMASGQQYMYPTMQGQAYQPYQQVPFQQPMFQHPHAQQQTGISPMPQQQQPGVAPLPMLAAMQHPQQDPQHQLRVPQYQPQPQSVVSQAIFSSPPQDQQVASSPGLRQDRQTNAPQMSPRTPPSQTQQSAYLSSAPDSAWLPNIKDIYTAGNPSTNVDYPPQGTNGVSTSGSFYPSPSPRSGATVHDTGSSGFHPGGMRQ